MDQADFPWRQLGTLLVDEDLLSREELERALSEQRRTGQKLGQIIVDQGSMSGTSLAKALAKQHGIELRNRFDELDDEPNHDEPSPVGTATATRRPVGGWRPLGKVLLDGGLVSEHELDEALAEKRAHQDRRLGAILVRMGHISGATLALALAEQHGIVVETQGFEDKVETITVPVPAGHPTYEVVMLGFPGERRERKVLYAGPNFLDAADYACEYIDREEPPAIEIQRSDTEGRETVWTYSKERAAAEASAGKSVVETFGFDPARWDVKT
jgi:hypothetical protein